MTWLYIAAGASVLSYVMFWLFGGASTAVILGILVVSVIVDMLWPRNDGA